MSPFRRPGSPNWQIRPTVVLPGRGRVRMTARSTGQTSKQVARSMERMIAELPVMGYADLVEELEAGAISLEELYLARLNDRLQQLRDRRTDPLLADVVEALPDPGDARYVTGLGHVVRIVEELRRDRREYGRARLSWLLDPANVQLVLEAREAEGVKRNSVRRAEYMALSRLLKHAVGREERDRVMRGVEFGTENDERDVFLRPPEIARLLNEAGDPLFRELLIIALGAGIDATPLRRIVPADFIDPALRVRDTKTDTRARTIELGDAAAAALRRAILISGAGLREPVFPWTASQVWARYRAAAERAGLRRPGTGDARLRFKDLRAVFATYYLISGGDLRELQHMMGHRKLETTLRYVKRLPMGQATRMTQAEQAAGLKVLMGAVA